MPCIDVPIHDEHPAVVTRMLRLNLQTAVVVLILVLSCQGARLGAPAQAAFQEDAAALESQLTQQHKHPETYLAVLNLGPGQRTDLLRLLKFGAVHIEPVNSGVREVRGGLVHHWRGAAFIPGAKANDMLTFLRDYDHLARYYAPEVQSSRALIDHGESATLALRLKEQKVVTVVLDAEYDVHTDLNSPDRGYSISRSTHIWQVEQSGTAQEHRLAEGQDDGFLWRLNSYWSFLELPDGLLIECDALSLTRDIPKGLRWLIGPIVQDLPRESLGFTLKATRTALLANVRKEAR